MNVEINIVEAASELAAEFLAENWDSENYLVEDEDGTHYTEEGQEAFDREYDKFYSILLNCATK